MSADLPVILGSSSKSRAKLLEGQGKKFTTMRPDIDEKAVGNEHRFEKPDPSALVLRVANAKADALLKQLPAGTPASFLITCDQVVAYGGQVREKPESEQECRAYLESYAVAPAETHSAVVVVHTRTGRRAQGVDVARQYFKPVPEAVVDELLSKGDIMYCCGGFMVDDPLLYPYLDRREGDKDSIIGLPLRLLDALVAQVSSS